MQHNEYNKMIIKWANAFDLAVCNVYKQLGKFRIDCRHNETN